MLLICVYMPNEGGEHMTDEFADQLAIVDGSFDAGMSAEVRLAK